MGTIKIGKAEEDLISKIESIKENYQLQLQVFLAGLELARRQISEVKEDNAIQTIGEQLDRTIRYVTNLDNALQGIQFSEEHDEEKFSISWIKIKIGNPHRYGYGNSIIGKPVTEKQFVFALTAWYEEVCKILAILKETDNQFIQSICMKIEHDVFWAIYKYVGDF